MKNYPELTRLQEDLLTQSEVYKPSSFWFSACQQIASELSEHGVENFRALPTSLDFFVPTYGLPGNCFTPEMVACITEKFYQQFPNDKKPKLSLEQFLSGKMSALADYRVLLAADNTTKKPFLHTFSESKFGSPVEQFEFDGKKFSRSSLNYLMGLALLKKHLGNEDAPKTVLEIGGGFGTLGEILFSSGVDNVRYIDIDIPPTNFVAQSYLASIVGEQNITTYEQTHHLQSITIDVLPTISVLGSWQIEKLVGEIDLFVNFISFQEMEPHIVTNYLKHVSRLNAKWILLRNMKEGKNKKKAEGDVGVETPILSDDYMSMLPNYSLVERNVFPFGYRTVDDFNSELLLLKRK